MPTPDQRSRRALIVAGAAIALITGLRLLLSSQIDLAPDEAYYWRWSSVLSLTYADHPPLVAWMVRLGTSIAGDSALGVRLLFVLSGIPAAFLVFYIGRAVGLRAPLSATAAVLASLLPAPAVASLLATPDTPLGLCWLVGSLALVRLAAAPSPKHWYALGLALGFGLLAKHSALLLVPAVIVAAILAPPMRAARRTAHPWLALLLAGAVASPHLIAEYGAESSSIALQLRHLAGDLPAGEPSGATSISLRLLGLVGGQIGLLTPLVALASFLLVVRRRPLAPGWRVVASLLLLPILATIVAALFVHPEQNWAALGHPLAAVLAIGAVALPRPDDSVARARIWSSALLAQAVLLTGALHWHAARPFLPLPAERDPVSRLHGWSSLADLADEVRAVDAVICDNYGLAAELSWQLRDVSETLPIIGQDRSPDPPGGRLLLLDELADWSGADISVDCDSVGPSHEIRLRRGDRELVRIVEVSRGRGCRPAESTSFPAR